MSTAEKEIPVSGRPRVFQNEDAFRAATRALMSVGYGRLTLEAVAREAGCSAPALSKRFGSKRGLVQAYLEWSMAGVHELFEQTRKTHSSPLAALRARYLLSFDRPEEHGPFTKWTEVLNDPELAPTVRRLCRMWEDEAQQALELARTAGELVDCDIAELARTLVAALTGAGVLDSADQGLDINRVDRIFDILIGPYRKQVSQ